MKNTNPTLIVGAGLAGLVAGYAFPGVPITEAGGSELVPHRALLRFRSDAVSRLTGIPFRRVTVRKGIWSSGDYRAPNVRLANLYSRKCLDRVVGDRSIWNVEAVERWIAPEDLIEQMTEAMRGRISWGEPFNFGGRRNDDRGSIISTAPLAHALEALELHPTQRPGLVRAKIWVKRYRVDCADAHQTVYFPDHFLKTYRASLTGSLLILELSSEAAPGENWDKELALVAAAMGLGLETLEPLDEVVQRFGKIVPLPDEERRGWMARLTIEANIYSLGRFATWRNILLDDVVEDADVIRRMLRASGSQHFHALRGSAGR